MIFAFFGPLIWQAGSWLFGGPSEFTVPPIPVITRPMVWGYLVGAGAIIVWKKGWKRDFLGIA